MNKPFKLRRAILINLWEEGQINKKEENKEPAGRKMFAVSLHKPIYLILSEKGTCLQLTSNSYIIYILSDNLGTHSGFI